MPFSSADGKQWIKKIISRMPHATILDVGAGTGTYRDMFPDAEMTAVEIWESYVERYKLKERYQSVYCSDVRDWVRDNSSLASFDVAILGDILEHMSIDDAVVLYTRIRLIADTVVLSIPIVHYPQGDEVIHADGTHEHNPHEIHVTEDWSTDKVHAEFGQSDFHVEDGIIGVYIWSKHKIPWPRIAVYAIAKNEEKHVRRFYESAKDADLVVVADTGSTDGTLEALEALWDLEPQVQNLSVYSISVQPWRFDIARNANMALIPADFDVCVCIDLDEELQPGWRQEIERVWKPETTQLTYMFDWGVGIKFKYEKIHSRNGWRWEGACHELIIPDPRARVVRADTDMLLLIHKPDPSKSRGQYLELLETTVKERIDHSRTQFYYARELTFFGRWDDAIRELNVYLESQNANWINERCYAMRLIGRCWKEKGDFYQALAWFRRACAEAPHTREPWCELALALHDARAWPECYAAATNALAIANQERVYTNDPAVWGFQAHDLAAVAAWNLGMWGEAEKQAALAVEKEPNDQRLVNNLEAIRRDRPDRASIQRKDAA